MKKYRCEDEYVDDDIHPSQDTTNRFPVDQQLRANGFKIAARPKRGEDIWALHGVRLPLSQALEVIRNPRA